VGFREWTAQFSVWKTAGKESSEVCAIASHKCAVYSVFPSGMTSHSKIAQFNWECIVPLSVHLPEYSFSLATCFHKVFCHYQTKCYLVHITSHTNNHRNTVILVQRLHTETESYNVITLFTASILQQAFQNRPLLEVERFI